MSDSVAVLESSRNPGALETTIQGWLDSNAGTVTSVDSVRAVKRGENKLMVVIMYTA